MIQETLFDIGDPLPPHNGTRTSMEAAASIQHKAPSWRERIFNYIQSRGGSGATRDEIERKLGISGNTVRPRITELLDAHRIRESKTTTRPTRSGRQAFVLFAMED